MTKNFFNGTHAAVIVYDATKKETFEKAKVWIEELKEYEEGGEKIAKFLVGNKIDLIDQSVVTFAEAAMYA